MRVLTVIPLRAVIGAMVALLSAGLLIGTAPQTQVHSTRCHSRTAAVAVACADSEPQKGTTDSGPQKGTTEERPLPAGDAPAFLFASVQPLKAPQAWRTIYHEVERCAGMKGDYDLVRWGVMEAPLQGPAGPTFGFTVGQRIVLVRNDTTYLRHEMLHHILQVAGWQPHPLQPGEHYTIADLHPAPLFGRCTGGR